MTTPNVRDIFLSPGRFSMNPTDLSQMYPHGGTPLGVMKRGVIRPEVRYAFVTAEEFGGERVEGMVAYEGMVVAASLHSYDADAIGKVFPNTSTGAVSGKVVVTTPGAIRPGARLTDRACVLVFTPDDEDRHPMLILRRALPAIEEAVELNVALDQEWGLGVVFYGIRDASGRVSSIGLRRDLSL